MALEPITRQEQIIAGKDLKPITRMERFLKEYSGASLISPSGKKFKITVDDNGVLGTTIVKEETEAEGGGAEFYTLAPTALSFRSTAPLSEFSEVQVNGETVDPANYTLEEGSTIVTFPIDYLKKLNVGNYEVAIVSDNEIAKGGFTVAAPELNEYGFYYNQPYYAYVGHFGTGLVVFMHENGTLDTIFMDGRADTCTYTVDGNSIVITSSSLGELHCTISDNGAGIYNAELDTDFILGNEVVSADDDYLYVYKEDLGGYEVTAIDKTKSSYGDIKTGVNGHPTIALADNMFMADYTNTVGNVNMIVAPNIPDTVTVIGNGSFAECDNLTSVAIPDSVINIGNWSFYGCNNLTDIYYTGAEEQWNAITFGDDWHANTPATYVQCSDGRVSLV